MYDTGKHRIKEIFVSNIRKCKHTLAFITQENILYLKKSNLCCAYSDQYLTCWPVIAELVPMFMGSVLAQSECDDSAKFSGCTRTII